MHQGARNQHSLGLAGGHFAYRTIAQVGNLQFRQSRLRQVLLGSADGMVRVNGIAAEEAREHNIPPDGFTRAPGQEIVGDDTEQRAQLKHIPSGLTEDGHARSFPGHGITLAGDGLDQSGLATPVRPQNGDMLAVLDAQREIVEHNLVASHDLDVFQVQECGRWHRPES